MSEECDNFLLTVVAVQTLQGTATWCWMCPFSLKPGVSPSFSTTLSSSTGEFTSQIVGGLLHEHWIEPRAATQNLFAINFLNDKISRITIVIIMIVVQYNNSSTYHNTLWRDCSHVNINYSPLQKYWSTKFNSFVFLVYWRHLGFRLKKKKKWHKSSEFQLFFCGFYISMCQTAQDRAPFLWNHSLFKWVKALKQTLLN